MARVGAERGRTADMNNLTESGSFQPNVVERLQAALDAARPRLRSWRLIRKVSSRGSMVEPRNCFGYKAEEVMGRKTLEVFKIEFGACEEREWTCTRKDGMPVTLHWQVTALRDAAGGMTGFLGTATNLGARRDVEEVVRSSEEHFRLITDAVDDHALYMLDPAGLVVSWNSGAQRIKGLPDGRNHRPAFLLFLPGEGCRGRASRYHPAHREGKGPLHRGGLARAQGWLVFPRRSCGDGDPKRRGRVAWICEGLARYHDPQKGGSGTGAEQREARYHRQRLD